MNYQGTTLRLATNADIPRLPQLLERCPELVRVRNFFLLDDMRGVELLSLVRGPFHVVSEDGCFVIYGASRKTGEYARARVIEGYLQYEKVGNPWPGRVSCLGFFVPEEP
jgi:hypothetical protein